ncbi:uncharacterized protein G2W53_002251 [Senna tora]|uniref:BP28 C-terminal domain-containing protein n=1 Tax=Senna tora TaxID=362788 RepID=A0A834XK68_9FABA|nr:uncharacterized protein G2W53_002251 [Senna tora]
MATTIAAQLKAVQLFVQSSDCQSLKRPFTRPSILFDPKEAADIDIQTIWNIALQGLEVLINSDERFKNYKNVLFSRRNKELDRELMGIEENNQINVSISSYLRLLSGYFVLPSSTKTLEYLIRRYKNTKWAFLDGVKDSGVPPPRKVIVQQCVRDKGIIDVLCNYASPSKKFQPSKHAISFCTAVFIEILGTVTSVNDDLVKRILPFVISGLRPGNKGVSDHKAASLMIIGMLGNKVVLAPKLLNSLIRSIAVIAREEAKELTNLQWLRLSLIALINLVQSQKIGILPKKALEIFKEIRNLAGILLELSKEFNIDQFLFLLLESLIDCSWSDEHSQQALISIIEKVPIKNSVCHVVAKTLLSCLKLSQKVDGSISSVSGEWAKKILIIVNKNYPSELRGAVHQFLQDNKVHSEKDAYLNKILCKVLDWNLDSSLSSGILKTEAAVSETISGSLSSFNLYTINSMSENFMDHPEDNIAWLVEHCSNMELSKTQFFLVLLQTLINPIGDDLPAFFEIVFPILKTEWESLVVAGNLVSEEFNLQLNPEVLNRDCSAFLDNLSDTNLTIVNANIIVCIFWRLLAALISAMPSDNLLDDNDKWVLRIKGLFEFFAGSQFKHTFRKHLDYLVAKCKISPPSLLSKFFTEEGVPVAVQVESLQRFAFLCTLSQERSQFEFLAKFPSVLVPLASDNQDTRIAAMNCIEGLCVLWSHIERSGKQNGSNATRIHFLGELLGLIDQQKPLVLSDKRFLPSMFASMLSSSCHNILIPQNIENRFDQFTKEKILAFILGSAMEMSNYGKLRVLSLFKGIGNAFMHAREVVSLLSPLMERHVQYNNGLEKSSQKLSSIEVEMLCLLLEGCVMSSCSGRNDFEDHLLNALRLDSTTSEDPGYVQPCRTVLKKLNSQYYEGLKDSVKEHLFHELMLLCRNSNGEIRTAAKEAVLRIDISSSTVGKMLGLILKRGSCILKRGSCIISSAYGNKKKKSVHPEGSLPLNDIFGRKNSVDILGSFLDILLLKKDITDRHLLMGPLFMLLSKIFSKEWGGMENGINLKVLLECAHSTKDAVTRNHVFSLLSAVTKVFPEEVFEHILDIVAVIGESAVTQADSHSNRVFEELISAIVPCWLSKTDNVEKLLMIFLGPLPEVVEHRRLSIVLYLLRTLGEGKSLASLLVLLFRSLISRNQTYFSSIKTSDALGNARGFFLEFFLAVQFTLHKIQDPEFLFKMEAGDNADVIQRELGHLMERIVLLWQLVYSRKKQLHDFPAIMRKELKDSMFAAVKNITLVMIPSTYFRTIMKLLRHPDKNVGERALGLLCDTARNKKIVSSNRKERKSSSSNPSLPWLHMNESAQESLDMMCLEIIRAIDGGEYKHSDLSLKMAAVSALEVLANSFPYNSIFSVCLKSVTKCINSPDVDLTSSCIQTTSALISVLGPKSLAELPHIMENVMKSLSDLDFKANTKIGVSLASKESYLMSVLIMLDVVVDKLGGFLNPYLTNIIDLLVLHHEYVSGMNSKMESRASGLRKLLAERIPVRLALPPLLKVYPASIDAGDKSLEIMFDMLATLVGTLDRSSVVAFHGKIFDLCLLALDLRRQSPTSIQNIDLVEKGVTNAMVTLTMKLSESMFKPLFIKSIEWAESDLDEAASVGSTDRAISFYGMVNKLAENHRSLFVPYFKHMLGSCVQYLSEAGDAKVSSRKKKKARIQEDGVMIQFLAFKHGLFLMLLRPIVSQLVVEPPASLEDHPNLPSVGEVDDLLVTCIGQMAVTAGNDLLWKLLNHEVLMQTRSEKVRGRMLGLRIVQNLVEKLKEEYLVFLDETMPFLYELLQDVEPCVKSLTQDIVKEMKTMSPDLEELLILR